MIEGKLGQFNTLRPTADKSAPGKVFSQQAERRGLARLAASRAIYQCLNSRDLDTNKNYPEVHGLLNLSSNLALRLT